MSRGKSPLRDHQRIRYPSGTHVPPSKRRILSHVVRRLPGFELCLEACLVALTLALVTLACPGFLLVHAHEKKKWGKGKGPRMKNGEKRNRSHWYLTPSTCFLLLCDLILPIPLYELFGARVLCSLGKWES